MPQNKTTDAKILQLDWLNNVGTPTRPPGFTVRLMAANGDYDTAGTEITAGGGYTAGGAAMTWAGAVAADAQVTAVNAAVSWTNMPACTVVGVEIWDTSGTPRRMLWGPLTLPRTVNAGDTFQFAAGTLTQVSG